MSLMTPSMTQMANAQSQQQAKMFQTMSLQTGGPCTVTTPLRGTRDTLNVMSSTNRVDDIEGARPEIIQHRYVHNRPDLYNNGDVRGARSKRLHPENPHKVIGLNLTNHDIERSRTQVNNFETNRRTNMLEPRYQLPSFEAAPAPVPKQLNDTNKLSDIEGTAPRPAYPWEQRLNHDAADIEGAAAGWKVRHERRKEWPERHIMAVADINEEGFKSKRVTDPLDAEYRVNGMSILNDPRMKPKGLPEARDGGRAPYLSLMTQDIEGAVPGWKPKHLNGGIPEEARRHFRNTNFVGDVQGALADSLRHGIVTNRVVDPLAPAYQSLDGDPLLDSARVPEPEDDGFAAPAPLMPMSRQGTGRDMVSRGGSAQQRGGGSRRSNRGSSSSSYRGGGSERSATESEKDAVISSMQAELAALRGTASRGMLASGGGGGGGSSSSRGGGGGGSRGGGELSATGPRGGSARGSSSSSRGLVRARTGGSRSDYGGGGGSGMPPRSSGGARNGGGSAERLVLRSQNGQPRVPATPSDRRQAAQLAADVAAVRGL
jgi:hypothetical protein